MAFAPFVSSFGADLMHAERAACAGLIGGLLLPEGMESLAQADATLEAKENHGSDLESENVLLMLIIVAVLVGILAWVAITAPNARPPSPQRRHKEWWGWGRGGRLF